MVEERVELLHLLLEVEVVNVRVDGLRRPDRTDHLVHRGRAVHPGPGGLRRDQHVALGNRPQGLEGVTRYQVRPALPGHSDDPVGIPGEQLLGVHVDPARGLLGRSVDIPGADDVDHLGVDVLAPRGAQARIARCVVDGDALLIGDCRRAPREFGVDPLDITRQLFASRIVAEDATHHPVGLWQFLELRGQLDHLDPALLLEIVVDLRVLG